MTAANLAVIFGPNLLQKERGSERELSPQALGIEDSTAIISVTLMLIQNHQHLFMVRERCVEVWNDREMRVNTIKVTQNMKNVVPNSYDYSVEHKSRNVETMQFQKATKTSEFFLL